MNVRLFKVLLTLDAEMNGRINLTKLSEKINASKNEFNAKSCDKQVFISGVYENFISLIISTDNIQNRPLTNKDILTLLNHINSQCFSGDKLIKVSSIRNVEMNIDAEENVICEKSEALSLSHIDSVIQIALNSMGLIRNDKDDSPQGNKLKDTCYNSLADTGTNSPNPGGANISNSYARWAGTSCAFLDPEINKLLVPEGVKEQIRNIARFINNTHERNKALGIQKSNMFFNMVISGNEGSGKDTVALLLYSLFFNLGILKFKYFIKIESSLLKTANKGEEINIFKNKIGRCEGGVIYIDDIDTSILWDNERSQRNGCSNADIINCIDMYKTNFIFIISGKPDSIKRFMRYERIRNLINFEMNMNDHSVDDLMCCGKIIAQEKCYTIDNDGEKELRRMLNFLKSKGELANLYTVKRLVDNAIAKKTIRLDFRTASKTELCALLKEDFTSDMELYSKNEDPFAEINSMIGMESIKKRVREIASYITVQLKRQEYGINSEPLCLHIAMTGNPGTGKTSVAKVISKIFYNIGALKKDKFVETSRDDLVGKYIGHTEAKTTDRINEAMEGTLFIDEAYALDNDTERDYGRDVISTLIKRMEDDGDKFCVIFAGYTNEMKKFIDINPGLRSRIQFVINFPDYKPEELIGIFNKFSSDQQYILDDIAKSEILKIFNSVYKNRTDNFSNGRLVRQCFERVKLHQSMRVVTDMLTSKEDLMRITADDIKSLYNDEEINIFIKGVKENGSNKVIGF